MVLSDKPTNTRVLQHTGQYLQLGFTRSGVSGRPGQVKCMFGSRSLALHLARSTLSKPVFHLLAFYSTHQTPSRAPPTRLLPSRCSPATPAAATSQAAPPSFRPTMAPTPDGWTLLGTPSEELRLDCTLPTGQSFRWRELAPGSLYVGVLGRRAVALRQLDGDVAYRVLARTPDALPAGDAAAIADYFNLDVSLGVLAKKWRAADPHFARLADVLPGARMLRQDPVECLFSFICSQNNHISRIHGMVNRLCEAYGTAMELPDAERAAVAAAVEEIEGAEVEGAKKAELPTALYAFPTLDQLTAATEDALRADGYGYRARYIVGAVEELLARPEGGAAWLMALRSVPFDASVEALCSLPGVGPKVAACVALFSLDKHEAVPVDVHVWNLATRRYVPALRGKPNNPKAHPQVQAAFTKLFGPYAGWAHNTLFIGELGMMKERVRAALGDAGSSEEESDDGLSSDGSESEVDSEDEAELFKPAGKKIKVEDGGPATPETGGAPVREVKRRRAAVKAAKSMRQARERAAEVAAAIKAE